MAPPRPAQHLGGKVDSHPDAGPDRGQEIPLAAAEFQDSLSGHDQEAINLCQPLVVVAPPTGPDLHFSRQGVPLGQAALLEGQASRLTSLIAVFRH